MTWLAAGDLLGPVPVELDLQLKLAGERLGTDSPAVAASALLEGYAFTLARPLCRALATGAPAPDLAAGNVLLAFGDGRLDAVATRDPAAPPGAEPGAVARLIGGHLALLVARLAERRVTCCLNYTVAGRPCATCPLLPPEETRRRLRDPASPGRISDPAGDARRRR